MSNRRPSGAWAVAFVAVAILAAVTALIVTGHGAWVLGVFLLLLVYMGG